MFQKQWGREGGGRERSMVGNEARDIGGDTSCTALGRARPNVLYEGTGHIKSLFKSYPLLPGAFQAGGKQGKTLPRLPHWRR